MSQAISKKLEKINIQNIKKNKHSKSHRECKDPTNLRNSSIPQTQRHPPTVWKSPAVAIKPVSFDTVVKMKGDTGGPIVELKKI